MKPRYFKLLPGERLLFWNWPIFKNGRWNRIPPPDDEPEMTAKEYQQQESNSHTHG